MNELVHPRERSLGTITLVLGLLVWLALIVGTFGVALIVLLVGFIGYLFAQSSLISYIKGNGVALTPAQFPDLHAQFTECCKRLEMKDTPEAYVLNGAGGLNAFATQFLGRQYVVLLSDVVDAMAPHPDGVRFYVGHELGHLRMKHIKGQFLRWPVLWLPLLGAAYSRARESTCDRHGAACSSQPELAARALSALAAGSSRWRDLDVQAFSDQAAQSRGFWMSFHELLSGYPWLTKRVVRVVQGEQAVPSRHPMAYLLAALFPYAGRLGAGFGALILIYVIGVAAAVAIPAYQDHTTKARLTQALAVTQPVREELARRYLASQEVPASLAQAGLPETLPGGEGLSLDNKTMVLSVETERGTLVFTPEVTDQGEIRWACAPGSEMRTGQVPADCVAP